MMDEENARLALVAKVAVTIDGIENCTLYRSNEGKYYLHLEGEFTPKELRRLADAMDGWDESDPTPKPLPAEEQIPSLLKCNEELARAVMARQPLL